MFEANGRNGAEIDPGEIGGIAVMIFSAQIIDALPGLRNLNGFCFPDVDHVVARQHVGAPLGRLDVSGRHPEDGFVAIVENRDLAVRRARRGSKGKSRGQKAAK